MSTSDPFAPNRLPPLLVIRRGTECAAGGGGGLASGCGRGAAAAVATACAAAAAAAAAAGGCGGDGPVAPPALAPPSNMRSLVSRCEALSNEALRRAAGLPVAAGPGRASSSTPSPIGPGRRRPSGPLVAPGRAVPAPGGAAAPPGPRASAGRERPLPRPQSFLGLNGERERRRRARATDARSSHQGRRGAATVPLGACDRAWASEAATAAASACRLSKKAARYGRGARMPPPPPAFAVRRAGVSARTPV
jgi:hypothetical protein